MTKKLSALITALSLLLSIYCSVYAKAFDPDSDSSSGTDCPEPAYDCGTACENSVTYESHAIGCSETQSLCSEAENESSENNPAGTLITEALGDGTTVSISGDGLPKDAGISLSAVDDINAIPGFDSGEYPVNDSHCALDITMVKDGAIVQPVCPVTVSLSADCMGLESGDEFLVYHIHENDDGTVLTTQLGPFVSDGVTADFGMDGFSYVIAMNSTVKITGVDALYRADGISTNGQFRAVALYYVDGTPYVIIGSQQLTGGGNSQARKVVPSVVRINGEMLDSFSKDYLGVATNLKYYDEENPEASADIQLGSYKELILMELDKDLKLSSSFSLEVIWTTSHGFDITGMTVSVELDYCVKKAVAEGTSENASFADSVTISKGDWVIYRIEISNNGSVAINDMTVSDILPEGVFDMSTVRMSVDGTDGKIGNWQKFDRTLIDKFSCEAGQNRVLYIKAQVLPSLAVTSDTVYTNTAIVGGTNIPAVSDSADIAVKARAYGSLTVTKNGCEAVDANQCFLFTVSSQSGFSMTVVIKGNGSVKIKNLPFGVYTVTENTDWSWRYEPEYDNPYESTLTLNADNTSCSVVFTNRRTEDKWLSGDCCVKNLYIGGGIIKHSGDV